MIIYIPNVYNIISDILKVEMLDRFMQESFVFTALSY